jgi:hypothetical protein
MRCTCLFSLEERRDDVVDSVDFEKHFYLCCAEHVGGLLHAHRGRGGDASAGGAPLKPS